MGSLANRAKYGRLRLDIKGKLEPREAQEGSTMVSVIGM